MSGQRGKEGFPPSYLQVQLGDALRNYLTPPKPQITGDLEERQTQEQQHAANRRELARVFSWMTNSGGPEGSVDGEGVDAWEAVLKVIENKTGLNPEF